MAAKFILFLGLILCVLTFLLLGEAGLPPFCPAGTEPDPGALSESADVDVPEDPTETAVPETENDVTETAAPETETAAPETDPTETRHEGKVRVGISNCVTSDKAKIYVTAVEKAGAEAVVFPVFTQEEEIPEWLASVDALIMTGGGDIDASYYGEENQPYQGEIDPVRDHSDILLTRAALDADLPMLCVCRGMQILNVLQGGSLYQDIAIELPGSALVHRDPAQRSFIAHDIAIVPGSQIYEILGGTSFTVNSWHHQAVKTLGDGLVVTAFTSDGVIEGIEMPGKTFVVGVQFHPEYHVRNGKMVFLGFFEKLISFAGE